MKRNIDPRNDMDKRRSLKPTDYNNDDRYPLVLENKELDDLRKGR